MKVVSIKVKNILGLEELEIRPGAITHVTGANGAGKTSVLEAIRAAMTGAHDATLLRRGAEKGEVVLMLEDGTEVKKTITEERSRLTVKHPQLGKVSRPATFLKDLSDAVGLNPIDFLRAPKAQRTDLLLEAMPMRVDPEALLFLPDAPANYDVDMDGHALEVLAAVRKKVYDDRTGINRTLKDKEATARTLSESLPDSAGGDELKREAEETETQLENLTATTGARLDLIKKTAENNIRIAREAYEKHKQAIQEELAVAIEKLRSDAEIEIGRSEKERDETVKANEDARREKLAEEEKLFRPERDSLKEKLAVIRTKLEQEAKSSRTREMIEDVGRDITMLTAESQIRSDALEKIDIYKAQLMSDLPVEGLEIRDGDIYLDNIPFDRVNTGRRVTVALQLARLRAGDIPLVCVDGLECLDDETYREFSAQALASGLQFVVAEVSGEGSLRVETEGGGDE